MSRNKNKLPDSLELLLDTMCNTFGAIMFIAISLVIISQISTKMVKEMQAPEITEEYLAELRKKVNALEDELAEEEQKMAEKALAALGMPKEKKEKVEKLLTAKSKNERLVLDLSEQVDEKMKAQNELDKAQSELDNAKDDVKQVEVETTQKERALAELLLANQKKKEELGKRIDQAQKEVDDLKKKLKNTSPHKLTFSMELSTSGLKGYTVCLRNGRLYREAAGEVVSVRDSDTSGHFEFKGDGHSISNNPEGELRRLLGGVGQGQFVNVFCDDASYDALVAMRKYLRSRRMKMAFWTAGNWGFGYGNVKASY